MQQIVACSDDGFVFGEPDKFVLKKYEYLTPEDCVPLAKVRCSVEDPKYGPRYKLLYESIVAAVPDLINPVEEEKTDVALVVVSHGPLFVDLRRCNSLFGDRSELLPGGIHLQIYVPGASGHQRPSFWPAIGYGNDIPTVLSSSGLGLAQHWLQECISLAGSHENCGQTDEIPILPTRVIDVGSDSTDVRLHISHAGEKGRWVALSHCWGNLVPIKTTASTIEEFADRLPVPMPQTFADAIMVTRALGERYLWIDSLCIIQDSPDDWVAESSLMHKVYSQALVTIVADAAENSMSGFLQPPARQVMETSMVHYNLGDSAVENNPTRRGIVHVRERGELAYQLPYHDFRSGSRWEDSGDRLIRSQLSTRAWAFQERLLSPRTLHFGPSEMAWECRALCSCECSATNERTSLVTSLLKGSIALNISPLIQDLSSKQILQHHDQAWRDDVVQQYTRLDLTVGTDRLHALAGVAARAATLRPGDQYIAGMWRNTLADGLSWFTTHSRPSSRLSSQSTAPGWSSPPSWSWAAVSGHIWHACTLEYPYVNIGAPLVKVSVHYQPSTASPMGAGPRRPAFLLAWGYVVPIQNVWYQRDDGQVLIDEDEPPNNDTFDAWMRSRHRVSWPPGVNLPMDCIAMMDVHKDEAPFDGRVLLDRLDDIEPESDLVMLLTSLLGGQVYGLILRACETSGAVPAYQRVGFVNATKLVDPFMVSSGSASAAYYPFFEPTLAWQLDEDPEISTVLGGIGKSMIKIW